MYTKSSLKIDLKIISEESSEKLFGLDKNSERRYKSIANSKITCLGKRVTSNLNALIFVEEDLEDSTLIYIMAIYNSKFELLNNTIIARSCNSKYGCRDNFKFETCVINPDLSYSDFYYFKSSTGWKDSVSYPLLYIVDSTNGNFIKESGREENNINVHLIEESEKEETYLLPKNIFRVLKEVNFDSFYFNNPRYLIPISIDMIGSRPYTIRMAIDGKSFDSINASLIARYKIEGGGSLSIVETKYYFKNYGFISQIVVKELDSRERLMSDFDLSTWEYTNGRDSEISSLIIEGDTLYLKTFSKGKKEKIIKYKILQ